MMNKTWIPLLLAATCAQVASAATVMAHFMVANSYAYNVAQWETDIKAAQQIGIDGFALNWTPPDCSYPSLDWMADRIADAYTAAASMNFKMMLSFDMSYSSCTTYWNQTYMASVISEHAGSSAALRWNSNIVVSTFGGDTVEQYGNEFFAGLKSMMKSTNAISLVPALTTFSDEAQASPSTAASSLVTDYPSIDGYLNWQAWPLNVKQNSSTAVDSAFKSALTAAGRTGPYIMAVSPWQFKDLNDGVASNAWVAYSDTLFPQRLHTVATSSFTPDIIEILTWNDFPESHYIRDLPSTSETATDYVTWSDGMNNYVEGQSHSPWRIIAKYYISWWKTGKAPAITMDQVVYWYRLHPKAAVCTGGASAGSILNYEYPVDGVFAWALVKSNATITMNVGSNKNWQFQANSSGPAMNMVPFPTSLASQGNVTPTVTISRNGKVVQSGSGSQPISADCAWQNFNPVVNLAGQGINR